MGINIKYKLIISLILLALPTLLYSQDTDRDANTGPQNSTINTPEADLLYELDQWLHKHGYMEYLPLPGLDKLSQNELCSMAFKDKMLAKGNNNCTEILALYNHIDNTIYINQEIDISSVSGKSILLHELVHHYQYIPDTELNSADIWKNEQAALRMEKKYIRSKIEHSECRQETIKSFIYLI